MRVVKGCKGVEGCEEGRVQDLLGATVGAIKSLCCHFKKPGDAVYLKFSSNGC